MENGEKENETPQLTAKKVVYGSYLEDRILKVKAVESSGKWSTLLVAGQEKKKDPFLFDKVKRSYQVPLNNAHAGGGVQIVLDNEKRKLIEKYISSFPNGMTEQEFFEKELGKDLNPRLPKEDNFWRMDRLGRVTLTKEGLTLDLRKSIDLIRYKILMANKRKISPSYDERLNSQSYEFMIVNENTLTSKRLDEATSKALAFEKFIEITRDEALMKGFIKALGRTVPANHTKVWLKAEILTKLEESHSRFLAIVTDPLFNDKVFIQEAQEVGAIKRINNKRYTTDGGIELGDLNSVISWLNDGDNQAARMRIKSQIEMAK